jgi:hypothetical protein
VYSRPIVPESFAVPQRLDCQGFHLRPITVHDLIADYDAVMASRATLPGLFSPNDRWPEGLTLTDDLVDLGWHEREATLRHSFCYTMMRYDGSECLGAVYIYPSDRQGYDVMAYYWVRADRLAEGLEEALGEAFRKWLRDAWPFRSVAFPGRDIAWTEWESLAVT